MNHLAALLVGVDDGVCGSSCALNAVRMSAMLRSYFGYPDERVIVMTDDNNTIAIPPTRQNVDIAMLNLVEWAKASAAAGQPATLWIYGCFSTELGEDGILRLQEQEDKYFTRDQFWRFLRMLPTKTRVICLIDGPTCNGMRSPTEEGSLFRYTGRRTQCAEKPIELDQSTPDLMFIFGDRSLHTVRGTVSPDINAAAGASQKAKRRRGGGADSEDDDEWGYLSDSGPVVESNDLPEHRITNVFTTALQRYDQRLSCTTLLRKMAAIARKARRDFVPVIETTRPLDPVRPFSATIDDRPLMMVTASMGAGGASDTEETHGAFSLL